MPYETETPFDNIESSLEYVHYLLEATEEAQKQIETEIERTSLGTPDATLARRKQALQLVSHKLTTLATHVAKSGRILNDLRTLRRLLLQERKEPESPLS